MTTDVLSYPAAAARAPAAVRVIRDEREWDALEPDWNRLFAQSPTAAPPLRFGWLREWWRAYGPAYGKGGLRIYTVWRGVELVGALPLYEHDGGGRLAIKRLRVVSTGEAEFEETCPEYLNLLHAAGEEQACLDAIRQSWDADGGSWDELDLPDVPADSPLVAWADRFRRRCRVTIEARGDCALANISGGLGPYLKRLSANSRQHSRRLLRAADRAGASLELASTAADVDEYFAQLVELHQQRWTQAGQPGCFAARRFAEFHRRLAQAWVPGEQAVLARLILRGEPLAVIYGFVCGDKFDFYQSGVIIGGHDALPSPGIVAFLLLMSRLADRGVERFDFLRARGDSSYKHRLSTDRRPLCRITVVRPTLGGWTRRALSTLRRVAHHVRRRPRATQAASPNPAVAPPAAARRRISRTDMAASLLAGTGAGALLRTFGAWRGALVLAYHRIGDGSRSMFDRELWSARTEDFEAQVRLLQRHADVIGPADLADARRLRRGRYALITFDDGYRDNYETVFPILKSLRAPALFLVVTGFVDQPRLSWWDEIAWMVRSSQLARLPASKWLPTPIELDEPDRQRAIEAVLGIYKSLPGHRTDAYVDHLAGATGSGRYTGGEGARAWMTWDMLREMNRCGMAIGGHTVNHPILAQLSPARQRHEIAGCARRIREELGQPMRWLSYPRGKPGSFDAHTRAALQEQGVEIVFSAYGGLNRFDHWDPYDVRRTGVEMNTSPRWLKMALTLPQVFT